MSAPRMTEADFLATLDDPGVRAVYADWLEQRGEAEKAELVRISDELWREPLDLVRARRVIARRAELSAGEATWRLAIARPTIGEVRRRVALIASFDPDHAAFGAKQHRWTLNAPLDEAALAAHERALGAPLPAGYRRFLAELGDGGAGPDYGLVPLAGSNLAELEHDELVGGKARTLVDIGCGSEFRLVLTGPDAGVVWLANDDGCFPLRADHRWLDASEWYATPRTERLELYDWYVHWLDERLWAIALWAVDRDDVFDRPVADVTHLNLGRAELEVVPPGLRRMTATRRLSFAKAAITSLPPWIGELRALEHLDLSYTKLCALPDELGELSELRRLSCFHADDLAYVPDAIGRLAKLARLDLQYCKRLAALPSTIGDLPLVALQINDCALTTLPASIGRLRGLTALNLRGNRIATLPAELAGATELVTLSLMDNELRSLPEAIGTLPALEELTLNGNRGLDLAAACRILAKVPTLRRLDLAQLDLERLPDELALLTQLTSLSISCNRLADVEVLRALPGLRELEAVSAAAVSNESGALYQTWYEMHPRDDDEDGDDDDEDDEDDDDEDDDDDDDEDVDDEA